MNVSPVCVTTLKCLVPKEARSGCWVPETKLLEGCEPPGICWDLNPGHLLQPQVLLTTEPPQPSLPNGDFVIKIGVRVTDDRITATVGLSQPHFSD